jgi:hypothetical protein
VSAPSSRPPAADLTATAVTRREHLQSRGREPSPRDIAATTGLRAAQITMAAMHKLRESCDAAAA